MYENWSNDIFIKLKKILSGYNSGIKSSLKSFLRSIYLSRPLKQFRQLTSFLSTVIFSMTPIQSQSLKSRPCKNGMHSVSITNIVAESTRPLGLCMGFKIVLDKQQTGNGQGLTNQRSCIGLFTSYLCNVFLPSL